MDKQSSFAFSQVSSNYYSQAQYEKIKSVRIGIAGAGGLGSNCTLALVRCGFEKFVIADFDTVTLSNLNRQQYIADDIDQPKVSCLLRTMKTINPSIDCKIYQERVTCSNVHQMFTDCKCVVEAFDNAESKAMFVGEMVCENKLIVSASGLGGYGSSDRIVTRKVHDNFYLIGDGVSEVDNTIKPYAPCVIIAAAKQADVVLQWVLER